MTEINWNLLDRLSTTLFTFEPSGNDQVDTSTIVANYSALKRKMKAAGIDPHHVALRTKPNFEGPSGTDRAAVIEANMKATRAESALRRAKSDHEQTRANLQDKIAKGLATILEHERRIEELEAAQKPDADIAELLHTAILLDRQRRDTEVNDKVVAMGQKLAEMTAKLDAVRAACE